MFKNAIKKKCTSGKLCPNVSVKNKIKNRILISNDLNNEFFRL